MVEIMKLLGLLIPYFISMTSVLVSVIYESGDVCRARKNLVWAITMTVHIMIIYFISKDYMALFVSNAVS